MNGLDLTLAHRAEDSEVSFNVANRLWGQEDMTFLEPFLDAMVEHFGAPLVAADFAADPDAAREEINAWVGETTEDRIPELFPDGTIDDSTRLALVNAMHLDAPWEFAFDPEATAEGDFTRADGTTVQVPMMHYSEYLPTGFGDDWAAVELPYEGGGLSMVVIVPEDLAAFEARLDGALLDEVVGRDRGRGHPPHDAPLLVLDPRLAGRAVAGHGRDRRLRRRRLQPHDRGRRSVRRRRRARGLHRGGRGGHGGRRRHRCGHGGRRTARPST